MATGVKPRDEDSKLTRADLEVIQDAMKNKKFRDLLGEYCEEIRDPANQAVYQKEMTQLEKERGYDVTFINPKGGYVIKTSVAGDRKAFINICSNENVEKPSCKVHEENGQKGMSWQIPYSIIPPREDYSSKKERCIIYDVVFHPDTLRMGQVNKRFRDLVNKTAFDGLHKTYDIHLDQNNIRFPKSYYKGMVVPAVIRKEDPDFKPPEEDENPSTDPDVLDKLYPQHIYQENNKPSETINLNPNQTKRKSKNIDFIHTSKNGYTIPKYAIKQQKNVDFQDYTFSKDSKQYSAIPSQIVVEINLPLLSSTKDCILDVREKKLTLLSEKPAKYKLDIQLPYPVDEDSGNAKFDKTKHLLIVTLPVVKKTLHFENKGTTKIDSGVESEELSGSHSEEETKDNLIEELNSLTCEATIPSEVHNDEPSEEPFLIPSIGYTLPAYTFNVLDDIVAFTFHVKNTDPESVLVKKNSNNVQIKFSSVGSGFVPVHYAAIISFSDEVKFNDASGEAWDNNVILQLEVADKVPAEFSIGLSQDSMKKEYFDISMIKTAAKIDASEILPEIPEESVVPVVEVTNLGTETNILLSTPVQQGCHEEESKDSEDMKETDLVMSEQNKVENGAKSILHKPIPMRSFSESSYGDVASSMDYISSDCIPEESSFKKTVRFSDVIARQFYRYNSSIEGQKRKNQRRKSKKRNSERRKSESEAEDDLSNSMQSSKPRIKSALKQRRDSGLADTSDAEHENKNNMSDLDTIYNSANDTDENGNENNPSSENQDIDMPNGNTHHKSKSMGTPRKGKHEPMTCEKIKHSSNMYNPDKLNKGQYSEIKFKNDLIFDLDM
ncbi:protein kintoun [Zerene cesonia]|uniref:protein kintoun n=1 Tax=Zerene cesonia TaxID=33412 RepID=UPI0018E5A5C9|nr:protein kintoun [Zerene cesonia]